MKNPHILLVLLLAGLFGHAQVTVFGDVNFIGSSQQFSIGTWPVSSLSSVGNDRISSVKIEPGFIAVLYDNSTDNKPSGAYKIINSSQANLGDFNDRTSHVIVIRDPGAKKVVLFSDRDLQGEAKVIGLGTTDISLTFNDVTSSLYISSGIQLRLCENNTAATLGECIGFGSGAYVYTGDDFNDKASFAEVTSFTSSIPAKDKLLQFDCFEWQTGRLTDGDNTAENARISMNGSRNDSRGFAKFWETQITEDNRLSDLVLEMIPKQGASGTIKGFSNWFILPDSASFKAKIGFRNGAAASDGVTFQVWAHYKSNEGIEKWDQLYTHAKRPNGAFIDVNLNLSPYTDGRLFSLELRVDAGSTSTADYACWVNPSIHYRKKNTKFLIIAPQKYSTVIGQYKRYKNGTTGKGEPGLPRAEQCEVLYFEDIYRTLTGIDSAECVKKAIYRYALYYNTQNVMLLGDADIVPQRFFFRQRRLFDTETGNYHFDDWMDGIYIPSDFYYANIFYHPVYAEPYFNNLIPGDLRKYSSVSFNSWDDNQNKKYNEVKAGNAANSYNPDAMDGYPDVLVTRLTARNENEVRAYLSKIRSYDSLRRRAPAITILGDVEVDADGHSFIGTIDNYYNSARTGYPDLAIQRYGFHGSPPSGHTAYNEAQVKADLDSSTMLVYIGHGSQTSWENLNGDFNPGDLRLLRNRPLFVFSSGCETGMQRGKPPYQEYFDDKRNRHNFNARFTGLGCDGWCGPYRVDSITDRYNPTFRVYDSASFIVPRPNVFDLLPLSARNRSIAADWLFNNAGGGVFYVGDNEVDVPRPDVFKEFTSLYQQAPSSEIGVLLLKAQRQYWKNYIGNQNGYNNENTGDSPRCYFSLLVLYGDPTLKIK